MKTNSILYKKFRTVFCGVLQLSSLVTCHFINDSNFLVLKEIK